MVRATNAIPLGGAVNAGNPSIPPVAPTPPPITSFPVGADVLSNLLPNLTPLAFKGPDATVTIVTLATSGATAAGSKVLDFASTKGLIAGQNYSIADVTTPAAISTGTTLTSFTGTAVTMSAIAAGPVKGGDKITLTPIATATQLFDTDAGAFLYSVASLSASSTQSGEPDTFYILYEDLPLVNQTFNKDQVVAYFSLPLRMLDSMGNLTQVMTNLQVKAVCSGGPSCLQVQAIGGITLSAAQLSQNGINFALVFAPSAFSAKPHAFFELQVPLYLTPTADPLYFFNPISNINFIFTPLPQPSIGIGPAAAPWCPANSMGQPTCPTTPTPPYDFALCAQLPSVKGNGNGNGNTQAPVPAVAAYYAISTAGETILTAPLHGSSGSVCPF
jgi:hypothetical protein